MFNKFFSDCQYVLSCEDIYPTKLCDGAQIATCGGFLRPVFSASRVQDVLDLHPKFALRPHHVCGSMVDNQSATAKIGRRKYREDIEDEEEEDVDDDDDNDDDDEDDDDDENEEEEETTEQKYNVRICYAG